MYNGTTFEGQEGLTTTSEAFSFTGGTYFTPSVGDWEDGNRMWVLSQTLRRIEYNQLIFKYAVKIFIELDLIIKNGEYYIVKENVHNIKIRIIILIFFLFLTGLQNVKMILQYLKYYT